MRAIFYLLLISLVLFLPSVYGETFPQAFSTSININANNCTISVSTEDSNSDFTFNITSPLCSITNTSNAFTFSKQVSPLFIRNVTCGDNLIENLTTTCTEMFEQVLNIGNFTQCKEGKARLEENFNNINEDFLSASSLATNKTNELTTCITERDSCRSDSVKRNDEFNLCLQEKSKESIEIENLKKQRISFIVISFIVGIIAHIIWIKRKTPRENFPKQQQMNPTMQGIME